MSIAVADKSVNSSTFGKVLAGTAPEQVPRVGAGRVRLPNKTQWSLRDILAAAQGERALMEDMLAWIERERLDAKGHFDQPRLVRLGELSDMLTRRALKIGAIERMAADARAGIYAEPTQEKNTDAQQR